MMQEPVLYLVVPCYNEQDVLYDTAEKLLQKMTCLIEDRHISARQP